MNRTFYWVATALVAVALAATLLAYPQLPSSVPSHWGLHNEVNGYSPRWTLFLLGPGAMVLVIALFSLLPWLSPKHFEVDTFRPTYLQVMLIIVTLLGYVHGIVLWTALGHKVDTGRAVEGGICLLLMLLGNVMGKVRRNFYVGIRTPWALANERVWNATHRFAAKTFVAGGVLGFAFTLAGWSDWPVMAAIAAGALAPALYSLIFYKQLERHGEV